MSSLGDANASIEGPLNKQWKKEQICPFFACFTADSHTEAGRHQLYYKDLLVLLSLTTPALLPSLRAPDGDTSD